MIRSGTIEITPEIHALIARVDEFRRGWRAMGELPAQKRLSLRRAAMVESVGSSMRIEGSAITDPAVEQVLSRLSANPEGSFSTKDEQEAAGYAQLMEKIFSSWRDIPFTVSHIRQMHRDLFAYSEKDAWHRGHYKTLPSSSETAANGDTRTNPGTGAGTGTGTGFQGTSSLEAPRLVSELMGWLKDEQAARRLHSLIIIALWVVMFLKMYPFQDGNGPLSRVLTTLLLLQSDYAYVEYSSLETVIEQNKKAYHLALRQTQETIESDSPNWQPWLIFFLRSVAQQVTRLEQNIEPSAELRD
jgi:Fic family protein